ncbi:MAG: hypothetical protein Q7V05_10210 [Methanoregula sp.]|nr:hypothetical protein [Methanoregula sp.]
MNNSAVRTVIIILLLACMAMPVTASVYYTSSAHQIITKGDTFSVSSTSAKNGPVAIWIIGRNYFDTLSVTPDRNGNFSISLKPTATEKFSSGQYAIVIQDPGPNGRIEIEPGTDSNGNLTIMNRGKIIEKIGARQDLKGNIQPVVAVLMDAANLQGVDDSFLPEYFFVEEPSVQFDQMISISKSQLSNHITGERLVISGTTNMGPENFLRTHIYNRDTNGPVISNTIPIAAGRQINHWACQIEAPGLPQGNYYLTVGWTKSNTTSTGVANFAVVNPVTPTPSPPENLGIDKVVPLDDFPTFLFLAISFVLIIILIIFAVGKK